MEAPEPRPNRRVMDSMFVDLYGRDATAPQNFVELYNGIHGTSYTASDVSPVPEILDGVFYMAYVNDVAMRLAGRVVVLVEHQSTINHNMPLRLLIYAARLYERLVDSRAKFLRRRQPVPAPEFYVLYNGREAYPAESEMRLSDSYTYLDGAARPASAPLELVVRVYNINEGCGGGLLARCPTLLQYSRFVRLVREARAGAGAPDPLAWAIGEAVRRGILPAYLDRKGSEVRNMLLTEYSYEEDLETQRWESREEGRQIGLQEGLQKGHQNGLREGRQKGLREGRQKGLQEGLLKAIRALREQMPLPQALDMLHIPQEERAGYTAMLA